MKTEKYCPRCKQVKLASEFYSVPSMKDGLHGLCMPCSRDYYREYQKTERGRAVTMAKSRRMYEKHKEKHNARLMARQAVKTGKIIKPDYCSGCLSEKPLQAHHEDYSKPLEVMWLCEYCHKHKHGKLVDLSLIGGSDE